MALEKKKSWFARHKLLTVIIAFFSLVVLAGALSSDTSDVTNDTDVSKRDTVDTTTKEESKTSLAQAVESKLLETVGHDSLSELNTDDSWPSGSKVPYITGFEDVSSGTVRMFVQDDISKEEAKTVGIFAMGAVGTDIEDLDFIVVRGTDGLDVNVSRSDVPALR